MRRLIASLNTYCPTTGQCASVLASFDDGTTKLYGDRALAIGGRQLIAEVTIPASSDPVATSPTLGEPLKRQHRKR